MTLCCLCTTKPLRTSQFRHLVYYLAPLGLWQSADVSDVNRLLQCQHRSPSLLDLHLSSLLVKDLHHQDLYQPLMLVTPVLRYTQYVQAIYSFGFFFLASKICVITVCLLVKLFDVLEPPSKIGCFDMYCMFLINLSCMHSCSQDNPRFVKIFNH